MRIRTVKPEFWTDATMVQLPIMSRLLFVGLWNCADDHGYIDDEPERLAMQVLPRETIDDVIKALELLISCGRIERLETDEGDSCLRVTNWEKHQRVDRPSDSRIATEEKQFKKRPIAAEDRRAIALKYGCKPGGELAVSCYFCGLEAGHIWWPSTSRGRPGGWVAFSNLEIAHFTAESKGGENTETNLVLACRPCNRRMATADGAAILLAKIREPSRALAPERKGKEGKGIEGKGREHEDVDSVVESWNLLPDPFAAVKLPLGTDRQRALKARLRETPELERWRAAIRSLPASPFLRGENDRKWVANFNWLIKPGTLTKIEEGTYTARGAGVRSKSAAPARAEDSRAAFEAMAHLTPEEREQRAQEAFAP